MWKIIFTTLFLSLALLSPSSAAPRKADDELQAVLEKVQIPILDKIEGMIGHRPADIEAVSYETFPEEDGMLFVTEILVHVGNGNGREFFASIKVYKHDGHVELQKLYGSHNE